METDRPRGARFHGSTACVGVMSMEGFFMSAKVSRRISVLACVVATSGAANAADVRLPAPPYKAPPVIIYDWAGFYVGAAGGFGFGATSFDAVFTNFVGVSDNAKPRGGIYGGFVGYNWQFGSVVAGVEADFSGADLRATSNTFIQKTDELASARARLGYVLVPSLLAYATGGGGWGHTTLTTTQNTTIPGTSSSISPFGWVAGGGLEYRIFGPVIARGEYLHYGLQNKTFNFPVPAPNVSESVDIVRGGLSYKF